MFKELLESIIERTEGSLGALIMGTDGIAVEKVLGEAGVDANLDVAAAEFTSLVRNAPIGTARRVLTLLGRVRWAVNVRNWRAICSKNYLSPSLNAPRAASVRSLWEQMASPLKKYSARPVWTRTSMSRPRSLLRLCETLSARVTTPGWVVCVSS